MIRKIIEIDSEKCNGCGLCAKACHEGAIGMVNDKAVLLRDDYCDGLGDCLPVCPVDAIKFVEREALAYDDIAVKKNLEAKGKAHQEGCPGSQARALKREEEREVIEEERPIQKSKSMLNQWPVQLKLVPVNAPFFEGANLLIAADCAAYAYADFHNSYMKNKVTVIGCPKLDQEDYSEKLTEILSGNRIKSVQVVRMEVPCCGGIERAVVTALQNCGKMIPWQVVTLGLDGRTVE